MVLGDVFQKCKKSTRNIYIISERHTWDGNFCDDSINTFAWAVHLGKVLLWKIAWHTWGCRGRFATTCELVKAYEDPK